MKLPTLVPLQVADAPRDADGWLKTLVGNVQALARGLADHATGIHALAAGQSVVTGSVTLRNGQTTTTVTAEKMPAAARVFLQAASGTWTSTVMRVTTVSDGSFVITHSNEAATDRVVYWHATVPS